MIQSNAKNLRQKVINLLYLVFLAFIFILIPSDFVDSTFHSNKSLEQVTNEIDKLNNANTLYFLTLIKNDEVIFEDTRQSFMKIEQLTKLPLNTIQRFKRELIAEDGINQFGYFNKGKSELTSSRLMLYNHKADSLFTILKNYKASISDFITESELEYLDELLPLKEFQQNSNGNYLNLNKFFFGKCPLNVTIMNLSHFESRIQRIKIYTLQKLIKEVIKENKNVIPADLIRIINKNEVENPNKTQNISQFYEELKKEFDTETLNQNTSQNKDSLTKDDIVVPSLYVESITDSVHPVGTPIKFNVGFDTRTIKSISVTVMSKNETKILSLNKPLEFIYFPAIKGAYKFSFDNGIKKITKTIRVIDLEPIIQNTKLPSIYIGIDNPLKIKITEYGAEDNLIATLSDGVILKKGDIFYARVYRKGIVKAEVFADMAYGRVKIAEQEFTVRELQPPIPYVNEYFNGSEVASIDIKEFRKISLKTDEYLVNEEVYIAEFDFMRIFNGETSVTKIVKNIGSSFNNTVSQLIKDAKPGDIFIFSNIKTKSSLGTEKSIAPLTLKIK